MSPRDERKRLAANRLERRWRRARWTFALGGTYGLLVLLPLYGLEPVVAASGGSLLHPEYYYGFIGVAGTLNVMFLLIARDPLRWHTAMLIGVCGKISFALPTWLLCVSGRTPLTVALFATVDLAWAVLFLSCWVALRHLAWLGD
jgi:hypothetical protein